MRTIKSADCIWSHYERIFVQALNYLAIPEIKNTILHFQCFFCCFCCLNVEAADAVVLRMTMTIYGTVWSTQPPPCQINFL
ncbi:hypothetical protein T10_2332 [Trichinella papuae]|uniref:Uncharacterized protein n=1 Tax=Trichinella papuae TaxID=268474 RepID=A0A0V1MLG8_9BILA|nr:hypothetical protein T10_2332 [Trichinella papuae]